MIIPRFLPDQIIKRVLKTDKLDSNEDYRSLVKHLNAWKKTGADWDDYRVKIDHFLLEKLREILSWCRREGFYFAGIIFKDGNFHVSWYQMTRGGK